MGVEKIGRRFYLRGTPYEAKDRLKEAGCKWDPDQRAWWTSREETARSLLEEISKPTRESGPPTEDPQSTPVAGSARHGGQIVRLIGRILKGRTRYDDTITPVRSGQGAYLLCSRDGTRKWWANATEVEVVKTYARPTTVGKLLRFATQAQANGGTHPDACPNCGSTACSAAYGRGGLCDED